MNSRAALFVQAARGPVLLILVGVLFAIQQAGILGFSRSWPLLIIAIGVMKLIERMVTPPQVPPPGAGTYSPPRPPYATPPYSNTNAGGPAR